MNDRHRLGQLRDLLDRLEHMPASDDRDWMLSEVRGRVVDVEAGMPASPLRARPTDELEADLAAVRPAPAKATAPLKPQRRPPARRVREAVFHLVSPLPPVAARERRPDEVVDLLEQGGEMCLDDAPALASSASRPWSAGLRA